MSRIECHTEYRDERSAPDENGMYDWIYQYDLITLRIEQSVFRARHYKDNPEEVSILSIRGEEDGEFNAYFKARTETDPPGDSSFVFVQNGISGLQDHVPYEFDLFHEAVEFLIVKYDAKRIRLKNSTDPLGYTQIDLTRIKKNLNADA